MAMALPRRQAGGAVKADHLAIQIGVFDDLGDHLTELGRVAQARRGTGMLAVMASWSVSSGRLSIIGVLNRPGAMAQTRMPGRASSRANGRHIDAMPPFEAE